MTTLRLAVVLALALGLAACGARPPAALQGYIEGTYVYVSAETAGRVTARPAETGKPVSESDVLAELDSADQVEAVAAAEARLAEAKAQLANLLSGRRPEEISVIAAELNEARSSFTAADDDYTRKLVLRERGVVAQSIVDDAKSKRDVAQARIDATERQLDVAKLPARPEEISAAERNVTAIEAALAQAKIALDKRTLKAPAAGVVNETFFEVGELVPAGQAVVSLLPAANKKVRFYLPEPRLAEIKVGDQVAVGCDGCADGLTAEVTFVATEAEFTPPVIYSKDSRDKLVFRVDARPTGAAMNLKAGQPVDVRLMPAGNP